MMGCTLSCQSNQYKMGILKAQTITAPWGTVYVECLTNAMRKLRVVSLNGAEKEFKASTPIKRIISGRYQGYKSVQHTKPFSPLPQDSKLGPGGIYYLVPDVPKVPCKPLISIEKAKQEIRKTGKLKIVITKQQLEFLLRNAKKFQSGKLAVRLSESFEQDYRKC